MGVNRKMQRGSGGIHWQTYVATLILGGYLAAAVIELCPSFSMVFHVFAWSMLFAQVKSAHAKGDINFHHKIYNSRRWNIYRYVSEPIFIYLRLVVLIGGERSQMAPRSAPVSS